MIGKVLLRRRLHRNFTIAKQCLFAFLRGVINTNEVHNTVLQCDLNLIKRRCYESQRGLSQI